MSKKDTGQPGAGTGEPPTNNPPQDDSKKNSPPAPDPDPEGGQEPPAPTPKTFTQEQVNRLLAQERRELEKKAKDAEERAKLGEQERLQKEADDLRAQLTERDARDGVKSEAAKLGGTNADAIYKLVKDDLEFDDKGRVKNLNEVLADAKETYPELFGMKKPDGAAPDAGAGGNGGKLLTKAEIEKMTPSQVNAQWDLVEKSLAALK